MSRLGATARNEALSADPVARSQPLATQDNATADAEAVMTHHCLTLEINGAEVRWIDLLCANEIFRQN